MITGRCGFNLYLLLALASVALCGCKTEQEKKDSQLASLRIHMEASPDDASRTKTISMYRAQPFSIQIQEDAILNEAHVAHAQVVDALGGFELMIQMNRQGTWLLQQYSASYSGKHYVVFSQFGEKGKEARWLAAPQFTRLISNGILQFTPDASREEAEEIAKGLNNVAKKNESNERW